MNDNGDEDKSEVPDKAGLTKVLEDMCFNIIQK